MRRIGIDARLYFQTGVGTYLRNFIKNLQSLAPKNIKFFIYVMNDQSSKIKLTHPNFIKRKVLYRWHSFSEQFGFLKTLYQDNLDLTHFTYFSFPVFYRKKFIATIHDLTPLLFKTGKASTKNPLFYELKYFTFKFVLKSQVKNSTKIITPSFTVKDQLTSLFGKKIGDKIVPIYEGIDENLIKEKENRLLKSRFKNKFFIYVGNFYPHKNVERLIDAFSRLKEDVQLILIGPDDFFAKRIIQSFKQLSFKRKIIFYHNPTPSDLVFFYKNALALIHPSLSEGFGLPLIEAAYFNCPIIASNIPVFKELLDEKYLSFSPYDLFDIKDKIRFFLQKKLKFDYKEIIKKYSFRKMTEETIRIYQELL